jgi:hypothetical protein
MFFIERKNQRTFMTETRFAATACAQVIRVFIASFSTEEESLPFNGPPPALA